MLAMSLVLSAFIPMGFNACGKGFKSAGEGLSVLSDFTLSCTEYDATFSSGAEIAAAKAQVKAKYCEDSSVSTKASRLKLNPFQSFQKSKLNLKTEASGVILLVHL